MLKYARWLFAGVALIACGCAEHRYYDGYYNDYHRWHRDDDRMYRRYRMERHEQYRPFGTLNRRDQDDYWRWRHQHHD